MSSLSPSGDLNFFLYKGLMNYLKIPRQLCMSIVNANAIYILSYIFQ